VDPRAGHEEVEKRKFLTLQGLEFRPLGRPARSQSLYRLHYAGSLKNYYPSFISIKCTVRINKSNLVGINLFINVE
jgi:hypothetical protein